jgi:predicted DNA-binding protein (MmcQ/YjbR family)
MNPTELRDHCLSFTGAEETFPFGPETSVFKVAGKMFALSQLGADSLRGFPDTTSTSAIGAP